MTATIIVILALVIAIPVGALVYRTHRGVGDYRLYSIADLVERATRDPEPRYGPDAGRIVTELSTIARQHDDQT